MVGLKSAKSINTSPDLQQRFFLSRGGEARPFEHSAFGVWPQCPVRSRRRIKWQNSNANFDSATQRVLIPLSRRYAWNLRYTDKLTACRFQLILVMAFFFIESVRQHCREKHFLKQKYAKQNKKSS